MRKVIVSMNVTLDGYMSGPDCELDWHFERWAFDMGERLAMELGRADTILLGRVTYQAMEKYWPGKAMDLLCPRDDIAFAVMMNRYQKVVYSNTLRQTNWNNSRLIKGDIEEAIKRLKRSGKGQHKDIIIYGSGKLVSELIRLDLIDDYHLWIHPVVLGKGKPLFRELRDKFDLKLVKSMTFNSGVVLLHYEALHTRQKMISSNQ